jgi:ElaB/YqjD/DUF883 family membrane-anchored ribosome-binding protein
MEADPQALLRSMRELVTQAQDLLEAGGARLGGAREAIAQRLEAAGDSLTELEQAAARDARRALRRANRYAEDNPWRVAAGALIVGLVLGVALGIGTGSRRD